MNKCIKLIKIYKKLTKNLKLYITTLTITLAEFMKTAPAGNRLGHTVKLDLIKELSSYSLAF